LWGFRIIYKNFLGSYIRIMSNEIHPQGKKILDQISTSLSPFGRFVSKAEIAENLPLVEGREEFFSQICNTLEIQNPFKIIPIIGDTGVGKTFCLWVLINSVRIRSPSLFINVPANSKVFYYNLYTKVIEKLGSYALRELSTKITNEWGASELKYGLFRTMNIQALEDNALNSKYYLSSSHKSQAEQIIRILLLHAMDPEKMQLAERWLLGDHLERDDLMYLYVNDDLSGPYMAEELFKLLLEYHDDGIILMFDDLDKNWQLYSTTPEINNEEDWTEQIDEEQVQNQAIENQKSLFDEITKLLQNIPKIKIVMSLHKESRGIFIEKFPEQIRPLIAPEKEIPPFLMEDTKLFYRQTMDYYIMRYQLDLVPNDPYFPLSERLIEKAFDRSHGNPREIIRFIQRLFESVIFEGSSLEEIEKEHLT